MALINFNINDIATNIDKQILHNLNIISTCMDMSSHYVGVIYYGQDEASNLYLKSLERACSKYNIIVRPCLCENKTELIETYKSLTTDSNNIGIIALKPIPAEYNMQGICLDAEIPIDKDIEAVGKDAIYQNYFNQDFSYSTCTTNAVIDILRHSIDKFDGLNAVIIGRSNTVGKPITMALLSLNCNVTLLHSYTKENDLNAFISNSDLLITATNIPEHILLNKNNSNRLKYVVDVGTCYNNKGCLVGNVVYDNELRENDNVIHVSPVPGGVGKITRLELVKHITECWVTKIK